MAAACSSIFVIVLVAVICSKFDVPVFESVL
jgi:hypothetical protein